ncbi:putative Ig domain-containing protein, partial [candidate division KSB1 bacterium]
VYHIYESESLLGEEEGYDFYLLIQPAESFSGSGEIAGPEEVDKTPYILNAQDLEVEFGETLTYQLEAGSSTEGKLKFTLSGIGDIDEDSGLITIEPLADDIGEHYIRVSVYDEEGRSSYELMKVMVTGFVDNPPEIYDIEDTFVEINEQFELQIYAEDENYTSLKYYLEEGCGNLTINETTGLINGTVSEEMICNMTIKVTDGGGQESNTSFALDVYEAIEE